MCGTEPIVDSGNVLGLPLPAFPISPQSIIIKVVVANQLISLPIFFKQSNQGENETEVNNCYSNIASIFPHYPIFRIYLTDYVYIIITT